MREKFNLEKSENWYLHNHQTVIENFNHELLRDMYIQCENIIVERRPDIVIVKKMVGDSKIIDLAIPGEKRIIDKEKDKTEMYWNLNIEILRLWNLKKIDVIPVVLGTPRSATKNFEKHVDKIGIILYLLTVQKTALLGAARILRKVLER